MNIEEYIKSFLALNKEDRAMYVGIIESKMFDMGYSKKSFFVDDKGLVTLDGSFVFSEEFQTIGGNEMSEKEYKPEYFYELPVYFRKVTKDFILEHVPLRSLMGCPERIGGDFRVISTEIETLEGCPLSISGDIFITDNSFLKEISFLPKYGRNIHIYDNGVICNSDLIKKYIKGSISITSDVENSK
jgi:hypothetical protein